MKKRMRIGLVGTGAIAQSYIDAIATGTSARLVAVADLNGQAARAAAADSGAAVFDSHLKLASAGICDAVIITTPPASHCDIAIDFLTRGIPVLCEKPLSINLKSAVQMTRAAVENGVLLSMASKFRFVDDVIAARELVATGKIGEPKMLENTFTGIVDMQKRWNSDPMHSGGGVLIDNATHSVDIVRYFFGPITEVLAISGPKLQQVHVEDNVTLLARTRDGKQATIETSWSIHKDRSAFIGIYGTEGVVEVGWKGSRIRNPRSGTWTEFGTGYDKRAAFVRQVDHFVGVLGGENLSLPDAHDALSSVLVIQAAYRSMSRGAWTTVEQASGPSEVLMASRA